MELIVENVQTYPRPPALEPVAQRILEMLGGEVIVDTGAALRILETHHAPSYYIPRADITADVSPASGASGGLLCRFRSSLAPAGRFLRGLGDAEPDRRHQGRAGHPALVTVT